MIGPVVILVPVLARPWHVQPLLDSVAQAGGCRVLFIPDPDDEAERDAIAAAGAEEMPVTGGWAAKINTAVRATTEPLIFFGADDLRFRPGWLEAAHRRILDGAQVVGVNDLIPRRPARVGHATHFLVTREYALQPTIDGGRGPLCEIYDHSFVDDELIATARHRGVYAYAADAHVQHLHPMAGNAPDDDTYRRGRARFRLDRRIYRRRSLLWT